MRAISIAGRGKNKYYTYIRKIATEDRVKRRKVDESDIFTYIFRFYWVLNSIQNLEGN